MILEKKNDSNPIGTFHYFCGNGVEDVTKVKSIR